MGWIQNNGALFWWLAAGSAVTFLGSLIAVPWFLIRIPSDYFAYVERDWSHSAARSPIVAAILKLMKNVFGYLFIAAGILMLVLPGQGILTLLVGMMLVSFPGKERLVTWLVTRHSVLRSINWLRRRAGRPPLDIEAHVS